MDQLWRYKLLSGFTTKNAGFSMWCFGEHEGKQYFIKQFLSPKYPADDQISSAEKIARKRKTCEEFEQRRKKMYSVLSDASDGNDVVIASFFRVDSRYYIATEKIDALPWTIETIAALEEDEKRRICALVVHAVAALHNKQLVHSDIKHDNILYTYTEKNTVIPKIIDFDGGFLESDPPSMEDGVTGDMNYFSPEVCARAYGEERALTCKLDIFALGVLINQYFSGKMPEYDKEECSCPGDAVLKGNGLQISEDMPEDVRELVKEMLAADPADRPSATDAMYRLLRKKPKAEEVEIEKTAEISGAMANVAASFLNAAIRLSTEISGAMANVAAPDDAEKQNLPAETPADMLLCPKCGNWQSKSMRFCCHCGFEMVKLNHAEEASQGKLDGFFFKPSDLL